MLYAGIAWNHDGYLVEILTEAGAVAAGPLRWDAGRIAELIVWLREFAERDGQPLTTVVESTNGLLDGPMTAAGLEVHRADPWVLPQRPAFGSVPARVLAQQARTAPGSLCRLTPEGGSLTGRAEEFHENVRRGEPAEAALTAAGGCLSHGHRDLPQAALSFDDGPDPVFTGQVLDILDHYGVRASFFCVGLHVEALPAEVRRIARAGHELGNHTWSHPYLPDLTPAQLREQIDRTQQAIERAAGRPATLFRPPYGAHTPEVLAELAARGPKVALWDVDSRDWARPGPEQIARTVLAAAGPGSVVLMHEGAGDRGQTVRALPAVIEGLLARGLRLVPVGELADPVSPRPAATRSDGLDPGPEAAAGVEAFQQGHADPAGSR